MVRERRGMWRRLHALDEIVPVADAGFGHEEDEEEIDDPETIPSESDSGGEILGEWGRVRRWVIGGGGGREEGNLPEGG